MQTYFGISDATSPWTLFIQTSEHLISSNQLQNTANRFVNFTFDNAGRDILNGIDDGARVIVAIARRVHAVESIIAGSPGAGIASASITKSSPGTEAVNAIITGIGSTVVSSIAKDTPANKYVEATLIGAEGALASADLNTLSVFDLSDFNQTGLEVDVLALITASGNNTWYADSFRQGDDTPDAGELGLGGTETLISRILQTSSTSIRLNDNNIPTAIDMGAHLGVTTDNTDTSAWTLYIQTRDGVVSSNDLISTGGGFANFRFDSADSTILNSIITGTEFIIAFARRLHSVEAVLRGISDNPITAAALGKVVIEDVDIEATWPSQPIAGAIIPVTLGAHAIGAEQSEISSSNITGISAGVSVLFRSAIAQQSISLQLNTAEDAVESAASFIAQVTVAAPENKSVEAVLAGSGSVIVSAITKTAPWY